MGSPLADASNSSTDGADQLPTSDNDYTSREVDLYYGPPREVEFGVADNQDTREPEASGLGLLRKVFNTRSLASEYK
jgi:hypothetical protein